MLVLAPFTLHRSPAATVRVEPPDLVIVEGPVLGARRFRRAQLRQCSPMLVRVYRERHDASFAAANAEDIVIVFQLDDTAPEVLGPFVHREGIAIADALGLTRRDLLFATTTFSVSVSADDMSLVVAARGSGGSITVPIPTADLHDLVVRSEAPRAVRYHLPTGLTPIGEPRWIELAFLRERPWSLGALSADDASVLVDAFRAWRTEHPIDEHPTIVAADALAAAPSAWHGRRIDVTAQWQYAFERSRFLGAWLDVPEHAPVTDGTYRVRVVGTWIYPVAGAEGGYGHMGCSPGEMRAETIEILEVYERPRASLDGLTGLPKRDAIGTAFERIAKGEPRRSIALALLDFDWLKRINDTYGHTAGDEVIRRCAATIVEALRPDDVVVRWAGEELAVLLPEATLESARELIERALASVRALVIPAGEHRIKVTLSAGVVEVAPGETFAAAIGRTDRALYEAKRAGRDRVVAGSRVN